MRSLHYAFVAIAFATSCGKPVSPSDQTEISVPPEYSVWWTEISECVGLPGERLSIRWFLEGELDFPCRGGRCAAIWLPPHTVVIGRAWRRDAMVVKHEMLHDLLQTSAHPTPPFGKQCSANAALIDG